MALGFMVMHPIHILHYKLLKLEPVARFTTSEAVKDPLGLAYVKREGIVAHSFVRLVTERTKPRLDRF